VRPVRESGTPGMESEFICIASFCISWGLATSD
jgi:hypothetical protein